MPIIPIPIPISVAVVLVAAATAAAQVPAPGDDRRDLPAIQCSDSADAPDGVCSTGVPLYVGWRVFGEYCAVCHGPDALGSEFAPNLLERLGRLDRRAFYAILDRGYFGRAGDMRPWGENPDVARYYEEVWSYLVARASGALPPGELRPLRAPPPPPPEDGESR